MLVVHRLGPTAGRYYRDGPASGQWAGRAAALLRLEGGVDPADLDAVLAGRSPLGAQLDTVPRRHRTAGWDLILAAPKSVSVVAALAPPPVADALGRAHARAVDEALGWLEGRACWARRDGRAVAADGLVAACFAHDTSARSDPHLHAHVLVANLTRGPDGRWSALDGSALWRHRRGLAAVYHLGLRHHLAGAGLTGPWVLRDDGGFDLAAVPAPAVEAASTRTREVAAERAGRPPGGVASRRAARSRTRAVRPAARVPAGAGFGVAEAGEVLEAARSSRDTAPGGAGDTVPGGAGDAVPGGADGAGGPRARDVERWLAARRSGFGPGDVLAALAATCPAGLPAGSADRWAERFVAGCPLGPDGRATTGTAAAADLAVVARAVAGVRSGLGRVPPRSAGAVPTPAGALLAGSGNAVDLLDRPAGGGEALLAQAGLLASAAAAWREAGHSVALVAGPDAAERWSALTGIGGAAPDRPPTILIVDRADRLATPELRRLLDGAGRVPAKVVLVRGGTLPARRRALAEAIEGISSAIGAVVPGPEDAAGPASLVGKAVAEWCRLEPGARMVGLGPAEVSALNAGARAARRADGAITGPELLAGSRAFAAGDLVLPLRAQAGPFGATGRVTSVDRRAGRVEVDWGRGAAASLDRWTARHLGHAYAVTPAGAAVRPGPLVVLGPDRAVGRAAPRVVAVVEAELPRQAPPGLAPAGPALPSRSLTGADGPGRAGRSTPAPGREPARDVPGLGR